MAKAVGPQTTHHISAGVLAGRNFHATVIPADFNTGAFIEGSIETQARQALQNLQVLLREAGGDLDDVVHLTVYLVDAKDLSGLNTIYKEFFTSEPYPARATLVVRELVGPPDMRIQATAQAYIKET